MRNLLLAGALACVPLSSAQAGQPIKESLVECAVLVELLLGEQSFLPGKNKMLDLYTNAAIVMREKAASMADTVYVARVATVKRDVWQLRWDEGEWDNPENRQGLADWWTYCFKLADHLDLKLEP